LAFWLTDIKYAIMGHSFLATSDFVINMRDIVSIVIAGVVVIASHNIFHKIRAYQL
jgi:hypothetical protein